MSETYCQKSCELCPERDGCGGCHHGPYVSQCAIAKCCREKGHTDCGGCSYLPTCVTNRARSRMPEEVHERKRREEATLQGQKQRISLMAAWLPLIFGAAIASNVVDLLFGLIDAFADIQLLPTLNSLASAGLMLAVAWGYWKLQEVEDGFHFVAVFHCVSAAFSIVELFLPEEGVLPAILAVLLAIFGVISIRSECLAYRDALSDVHQELSEKWEKQWTHTTYALLGLVGTLLALLIPVLGLLVLLGALLFIVVLAIRKLVYLYQTMEFCREFSRN